MNVNIDILRSVGIYATSGKSSEWIHQDVVAWGRVRIEAKRSTLRGGRQYKFGFETQQRAGKIESHLVVLICDNGDQQTFHVFRSTDPVFYRKPRKQGLRQSDGGLKTAVCYEIAPKRTLGM